jgi:transcription initiation factor TFIID subunit 5
MEVQKIKENRDRLKIDSRTGGIGPGLSVVMYTFHNTSDNICCIDIAGDTNLVAAGFSESYIRIWTLDGSVLGKDVDGTAFNSRRLIGHSGPVYAVAFAPSTANPGGDLGDTDSRWLLSSSADGTIRLWTMHGYQCFAVYKGHVGPVWSVCWGPYGHYFASVGHDKTARVWATDEIRQLRFLVGHDDCVDVATWHPNSAYVFTASSDKTVRMWAITNGNPVRMFTGHTCMITALACSNNGKYLASADENGSILIWDLGPGRLLKKMRGHGKGGIWSLSWSSESTVLVSGGADCTVRAWDVTGAAKEAATTAAGGKADGGGATTSKTDGASSATLAAAGATASASGGTLPTGAGGSAGGKKRVKAAVVSSDQISAFATKQSPVYYAKFTNMNLVLAAGAFLPEQGK